MSTVPYMPLFVADYLGDTTHLSTEEHGAYLLLLMAMWQAGGELPDDPARLARMARLTPKKWEKIAPVVLAYFEKDCENLMQKRLTKERQKVSRTSEAKRRGQEAAEEAKRLKKQETPSAYALAETPLCAAQNAISAGAIQYSILNIQDNTTLQTPSLDPCATGAAGEGDGGGRDGGSGPVAPPGDQPPHDPALHDPPGDDDWPAGLFADHRVAERVCGFVGSSLLDPARQAGLHLTAGQISAWRAHGCSWTLDVLPALSATMARIAAKPRPDAIRSWLFFDGAVYGNRDRRLASGQAWPKPEPAPQRSPEQARLAGIASGFAQWRGPGTSWPVPGQVVPDGADLDAALAAYGSRADRVRLAGWRQAEQGDGPGDEPGSEPHKPGEVAA